MADDKGAGALGSLDVAVLGTGVMGAGMARSLLRGGHRVTVWNRTAEKAAPLADQGAVVADAPAAAVRDADVVVAMLFDADAVLEVLDQAGDAARGPVWLQSSTIGPEGARRVAAYAEEHGLSLLDAPVLGTRQPAEQGALVMLVSGDPALRDRVEPALAAMGSRTLWVGDEPGAASALKLACNTFVATVNAGLAQSLAVASTLGVDASLVLDALAGGPLDSAYVPLKGKAMLADEFPVAFALDGVRKDLALITGSTAAAGTPAPVADAMLEVYERASEAGLGDKDMAAVHRVLR